MSIAADYARVVDAMHQPLPAYVSYVRRQTLNGMSSADTQSRIVVRTADKKIVHGKNNSDGGVNRPVFDPACYRATGEKPVERDGRGLLSFALAPTCGTSEESPFTALVVDPASMRPIEATGSHEHDHAVVNVVETFTTVRGFTLPAALKVDVAGTGAASFLQIHVTQTYSEYAFHASDPG
jgi:hypothetical protein